MEYDAEWIGNYHSTVRHTALHFQLYQSHFTSLLKSRNHFAV